jgi:hypothetical protein
MKNSYFNSMLNFRVELGVIQKNKKKYIVKKKNKNNKKKILQKN